MTTASLFGFLVFARSLFVRLDECKFPVYARCPPQKHVNSGREIYGVIIARESSGVFFHGVQPEEIVKSAIEIFADSQESVDGRHSCACFPSAYRPFAYIEYYSKIQLCEIVLLSQLL